MLSAYAEAFVSNTLLWELNKSHYDKQRSAATVVAAVDMRDVR